MQGPRRDIWTPVAGFLAAVTFVVGLILVANSPGDKDTDAQVVSWYAEHGHRLSSMIGAFVLAFCGLFLLWFAAGLRQRLRAAEGGGGRLADVTLGGAILFVGALFAGAAALVAIPAAQTFGSTPHLQDADLGRFLPAVGYVAILIFGAFGAIAMIDSAAIVIMRTGVMPTWLAWLGFVATIVLLFGVVFLPMIALPIWLVAASVVLLRSPSVEAQPVVPAP